MKVKQSDLTITAITSHADELWLRLRYPDGEPVCPYCGQKTRQYLCKDGRYKCNHCNRRYSSRVGTAFHNSKLTTAQIMLCLYLVLSQPAVSGITVAGKWVSRTTPAVRCSNGCNWPPNRRKC